MSQQANPNLETILTEFNAPRSILETLIETNPTPLDSLLSRNEVGTVSHQHAALSWWEIRTVQQIQIAYERAAASAPPLALKMPRLPRLKKCPIGPFRNGFCTSCGLRQAGGGY